MCKRACVRIVCVCFVKKFIYYEILIMFPLPLIFQVLTLLSFGQSVRRPCNYSLFFKICVKNLVILHKLFLHYQQNNTHYLAHTHKHTRPITWCMRISM